MKLTVKQLKQLIKEQVEEQIGLSVENKTTDTYEKASFDALAKKVTIDQDDDALRELEDIVGKVYVTKKGTKIEIGDCRIDEDDVVTLFAVNDDIITYYPHRSNYY